MVPLNLQIAPKYSFRSLNYRHFSSRKISWSCHTYPV